MLVTLWDERVEYYAQVTQRNFSAAAGTASITERVRCLKILTYPSWLKNRVNKFLSSCISSCWATFPTICIQLTRVNSLPIFVSKPFAPQI